VGGDTGPVAAPSPALALPEVLPRAGLTREALFYLTHWADVDAQATTQNRVRTTLLNAASWMAAGTAVIPAPVTPALLYRWCGVLAGCPDAVSRAALAEMLLPPVALGELGTENDRSRWLLLGNLGPVAYAAGLTLAEAQMGAAAGWQGSWSRDRLVALAGLRGWSFPPGLPVTLA
jgi:hypothetical protein